MKSVKIGEFNLELPLIQGGMGVGVSLGGLAGSVAQNGGMGVISSVNAGYMSAGFLKDPLQENLAALETEIKKALEIAKKGGMVAVNIMVATTHYAETVAAAIKAGVQAIISGAGLPLELPALAENSKIALAPIVSSGKATRVICTMWDRKHSRIPDFIVAEGSKAGGHLGFKTEELLDGTVQPLEEILDDVLLAIKPFENKYGRKIPVFVAGGVRNGADIARFVEKGATGAQLATCFIATDECDANINYKQAMINAKKSDICIIKSPVGMPGRALNSPLVQKLAAGEPIPRTTQCTKCLVPCNAKTTPYCISNALVQAVQGNWEDGLFFCGSDVESIKKIIPVKQLIDRIKQEWSVAE